MSSWTERCARDPELRERTNRRRRERYATDPEYRKKVADKSRGRSRHDPERYRRWIERLKNGEIQLPELDWAICERGGSEAQARAHRRRNQTPCAACLRAETRAKRGREERKRAA